MFFYLRQQKIMNTQGIDPLTLMNNAKDYLFGLLSLAGFIILGISVFQLAMSFKSEDGTAKAKAILGIAAGALMAGVGIVVNVLTGTAG